MSDGGTGGLDDLFDKRPDRQRPESGHAEAGNPEAELVDAGRHRTPAYAGAVAGPPDGGQTGAPPPPPPGHFGQEYYTGARRDHPAPEIVWPTQYGRGARMFAQVGSAFALALDVVRLTFRRGFQVREFVQQFWFVASVSILPAMLVAIPFGAVIALQLGTLTVQIGAQSFTGSAAVLAVVQQASPLVCALMISGAAGTAICADLGARTIRDEIDAMSVLGISPVQRLIVPRVWAAVLVAVLLNGLISVVGIAGGYVFNVIVQGGTPGAYLASFSALAQLSDLFVGELKAIVFGFIAAIVASYRGLHPRPGPKGVGDAVNESVVFTFLLLFLLNLAITVVYLQIVPAKGA